MQYIGQQMDELLTYKGLEYMWRSFFLETFVRLILISSIYFTFALRSVSFF